MMDHELFEDDISLIVDPTAFELKVEDDAGKANIKKKLLHEDSDTLLWATRVMVRRELSECALVTVPVLKNKGRRSVTQISFP
jgi:hypothetical protein